MSRRLYTNLIADRQAWLFIDSVFPVRVARWDLRHYLGLIREPALLSSLSSALSSVSAHRFRVIDIEPFHKDGGVFVRFSYAGPDDAPAQIERAVREELNKHGGVPSWFGVARGDVWLVRGNPWREDMSRFASPILKISFQGPDVHEESLYNILRPCGPIENLAPPAPVPAGTPRSSLVAFKSFRGATIARNVVHGLTVTETGTLLRVAYERPIKAHMVRDWATAHPRIVLPIVVFFLGTITYTVFDPIRALMIEEKMLGRFDYRKWGAYTWLRSQLDNAVTSSARPGEEQHFEAAADSQVWKERTDAVSALQAYLGDPPSTIAFVHGPQGSGKTRMLNAILRESDRKSLTIDCADLSRAASTSDTHLISALARQLNYRPIFTFLTSFSSLIDLASVGLIGQKAGMSTSVPDQLKQILGVATTALSRVSAGYRKDVESKRSRREAAEEEQRRRRALENGTWRDGRLDCVSGNGVMAELGGGDERTAEVDWEAGRKEEALSKEDRRDAEKGNDDVAALPIVIIKNFEARGAGGREEVLDALAQWAAELAENQIAHVVVISDNRENAKRLAKAIPTKPLTSVALSDADTASALSFVREKLHAAGVKEVDSELDMPKQRELVARLGGRASDLESLIHKIRSGSNIEEAVEDIIVRGVSELRKSAFGDDVEDAKTLPWAREQAWAVLKLLAAREEVPYHDVLLDFPFKGDEGALRSMEHAELITIGAVNGRASMIRPGKPVYKYVFERLVSDPVFQATQDIALNERAIAGAESTVAACEKELVVLHEIGEDVDRWWGWGGGRARYVREKMAVSAEKVEKLEKKNTELRKVLKRGEQ